MSDRKNKTSSAQDPRRLAYELGRSFALHSRLEELIPFAVAKCREVLDAEGTALVMFYDAEHGELYFPHVAEVNPAVAARLASARFPAGRGIAGAALQAGKSIRVDDPRADPRFYPGVDECTGLTTRALLCAPLIGQGGAIGVVEVVNPRGRAAFDDRDLALLDAIAASLAEAIERARDPGGSEDTAASASAATTHAANLFRKEGDIWTVRFEGKVVRLKDTIGAGYLALLLRHPGREIHAIEVQAGPNAGSRRSPRELIDHTGDLGMRVGAPGDAGPITDARARAAYKERVEALRDEIGEAERFNDIGRAAQLRAEMAALEHELAATFGRVKGEGRRAASPVERARLNVTRAIKAVVHTIAQHHPALGEHLRHSVKTGTFCSYAPDPQARVEWQF